MKEVPDRPEPRGSYLDRFIGWLSPAAGARRAAWREAAPLLATYYRSGTRSRLDDGRGSSTLISADEIADLEREEIVDRNRDLERNYPSYDGLIGQAVVNVIGAQGLMVQARTEDPGFNAAVEAMWADWCEGACDVRRMASMAELQELWFRSYLRDGDVGIVLLRTGDLQTIETQLIVTPSANVDGSVVDGVVLDPKTGRPVAFHVAKSDRFIRSMETTRIPARDFVFFAHRKRPSQTRGLPAITKPWLFEQYDKYIEATVVAARVAACFGVIFKKRGGSAPGGLPMNLKDGAGNARKSFMLEPGMAKYIDTDEEIEQLRPQHPGGQFGELRSAIKRDIGLPLGMPLELTDLDFSRTNYSSARASLLAAYRTFMRHQERFASIVMRRIYQWRVSKWVKDGTLSGAPETYWTHEWVMPRWPWVDPLKEIQANLLGIDAGITTRADVCASQGKDWEEQAQQQARERKLHRELNLPEVHSNMSRDGGQDATPAPIGGHDGG